MKYLTTICICFFAVTLQAQLVTVKKQYKLQQVNAERTYHPQFNEQGTQLLLTSSNFVGLDLVDLSTQQVTTLSTEEGAGYQAQFMHEDQKVMYVSSELINRRRHSVVKQFNLRKTAIDVVSSPMRAKKEVNLLVNQQIKRPVIKLENLRLVLYIAGERRELQPLADVERYLWPSLSPNGDKIVFTAVGKGSFVCDLTGKIIASLGYLNAPVWYGNAAVVGMNDKDDGDRIVSSSIDMVKADGSVRQTLTKEAIALFPAASQKAQKVAYTTEAGELYILELTQP